MKEKIKIIFLGTKILIDVNINQLFKISIFYAIF